LKIAETPLFYARGSQSRRRKEQRFRFNSNTLLAQLQANKAALADAVVRNTPAQE
jgi:hypothetical protein